MHLCLITPLLLLLLLLLLLRLRTSAAASPNNQLRPLSQAQAMDTDLIPMSPSCCCC
jgi:hypothetical protein